MKHWGILPPGLKIVASLFIIGGALAAAISFALLTREPRVIVTAGLFAAIIGVLTGIGLLWLNPGWKKFAVAVICLNLFVLPLVLLAVVMNLLSLAASFKQASLQELPPNFRLLLRATYRHYAVLAPILGVSWSIQFWAYRALKKPAVRRLFGEPDR